MLELIKDKTPFSSVASSHCIFRQIMNSGKIFNSDNKYNMLSKVQYFLIYYFMKTINKNGIIYC